MDSSGPSSYQEGDNDSRNFLSNLYYDLHYYRSVVEKAPLILGMVEDDDDDDDESIISKGIHLYEEAQSKDDSKMEEDEEEEQDTKVKIKREKLDSGETPPPLTERSTAILALLTKVAAGTDEDDDDEDDDQVVQSGKKKKKKSPNIWNMMDKKFRFCPRCSNLLQVNQKVSGKASDAWRWKCMTCPYSLPVTRQHRYVTFVEENPDDDQELIVESSKANEHRQKTEVICPECSHNEAYFYQMQTRSADEPMTNFYECCNRKCGHHWRD